MAREEYVADSASSQVFWLLFESDLTPAGKNLLDGRYACFGYTIEVGLAGVVLGRCAVAPMASFLLNHRSPIHTPHIHKRTHKNRTPTCWRA